MNHSKSPLLVIPIVLVASVLALGFLGQDAPKPNKRAEFMRMKLDFSKKILEGLVTEDFDCDRRRRGEAEAPEHGGGVGGPDHPQRPGILPFTTDFQRIADDLQKPARARNLDGATLAYTRMTINCVECHKYVRGVTR